MPKHFRTDPDSTKSVQFIYAKMQGPGTECFNYRNVSFSGEAKLPIRAR